MVNSEMAENGGGFQMSSNIFRNKEIIKISTKSTEQITKNYWKSIEQKLLRNEHVLGFDESKENNVVFTDQVGNSTIRESILNIIESARKTIFASTWLINEQDILQKLIDKSYKMKGGVYLLAPTNPKWDYIFIREENDYLLSSHTKALNKLRPNLPIAVRGHPNAHFKMWIGDTEKLLISSANLRTTSLGNNKPLDEDDPSISQNEIIVHQPYGIPELGIYTKNRNLVKRSKEFFKMIWYNSKPLGFSLKDNKELDFQLQLPSPISSDNKKNSNISVHWTLNTKIGNLRNYKDYSLEQQSTEIIKKDFDTILISTYDFSFPKREIDKGKMIFLQKLRKISEVIKRNNKQLDIKILTKKFNYKNFGSEKEIIHEIFNFFDGHKIEVRKHDQNHSKFILFLKEEEVISGILLTGNLFNSLLNGIECGYVSYDKQVLNHILSFFQYLWSGASYKLDMQDSLKEATKDFNLKSELQEKLRISIFDRDCLILESVETISLNRIRKLFQGRVFECYLDKNQFIWIISSGNEIGLKIKQYEDSYYKLEGVFLNENFDNIKEQEIICPNELEFIWE